MADKKNNMDIKVDFFFSCMNKEIENSPNPHSHFLRVGGINKNLLTLQFPQKPEAEWSYAKATKQALIIAIYDFFQVFDQELYMSWSKPDGIMTRIVWAKFRDIMNNWLPNHRENLELIKYKSMRGYREEDRKSNDQIRQERGIKRPSRRKTIRENRLCSIRA